MLRISRKYLIKEHAHKLNAAPQTNLGHVFRWGQRGHQDEPRFQLIQYWINKGKEQSPGCLVGNILQIVSQQKL